MPWCRLGPILTRLRGNDGRGKTLTSVFRLAAIAVLFSVLSACAITPERHREARLMPEKVALQIVARYTSTQWANAPTLQAKLANHPSCSDQTNYPVPYETMGVVWDFVGVVAYRIQGGPNISFWCGSRLGGLLKFTNTQEQDEFIDALTSLGARIRVSQ
jgi:hypothetical protein